uniref:Putative secreted protein n=1 Tax=Amblyomma parvum TaxID=251391 RepID=A0A023G026_AMBPA
MESRQLSLNVLFCSSWLVSCLAMMAFCPLMERNSHPKCSVKIISADWLGHCIRSTKLFFIQLFHSQRRLLWVTTLFETHIQIRILQACGSTAFEGCPTNLFAL